MNFDVLNLCQYLGSAEDASLEGRLASRPTDMKKHDDARHGGHFDPDTMTCKLRDDLGRDDDADADVAEGSILPGSQKAGTGSDDPDRAYAEAVERGDMETARRMVREAAARAMPYTKVVDKDGLPMVVHHGTPKYFNAFDKKFIGSSNNMNTFFDGFYFGNKIMVSKPEKIDENGEGWHDMACFVNLTKPFEGDVLETPFDTVGVQEIADVIYKGNGMHPDHYDWLIRNEEIDRDEGVDGKWRWIDEHYPNGIDGVIIRNCCYERHDIEVIATEPTQIKSAEVTYDDADNLIPLSKRFDFSNPDIRY